LNGRKCEDLSASTAGGNDIQKLTLTVKDRYFLWLLNSVGAGGQKQLLCLAINLASGASGSLGSHLLLKEYQKLPVN